MTEEEKRWLSVDEAAEYIGCSKNMLDKDRTATGTLNVPFTRFGRLIRYDRRDLDRYLEERKTGKQQD